MINQIFILNSQGIDPSIYSQSHWKLPYFIENHITNQKVFIPAIAVCETWLKPHISNAQITIPNYQIIRADRKKRDRGGALLYIHDDLPVSNEVTYDDHYCQAAMCTINTSNTVIVCVYRPPNTPEEDTRKVLNFINTYIESASVKHHMDIIVVGDINLPCIQWNDLTVKNDGHARSAQALLSFMADNMLSQYVSEPTRNNNILDLFLTNNCNLPLHVSCERTKMSDHNIVSVLTKQSLKPLSPGGKPTFPNHTFRNLNIRKDKLEPIKQQLASINWDELKSHCSEQDFPELFRLTVLQICQIHCSPKSGKSKPVNKFVKERKILNRKRRKLNNRLLSARSSTNSTQNHIENIENQLSEIIDKIKSSISKQKEAEEAYAVNTVSTNPSYFFSYAKRFNKQRSTTGPLLDSEGKLQQDPKKMADMLQQQYASVFSDPSAKSDFKEQNHEILQILENIEITCEDIVSAIKEIGEFSSSAGHDIPAIILKNCAQELSYPLKIMWKDSLNSGFIADNFKSQLITPVFKKGSKSSPANYRPISLTSHLIKIFERVLRPKIVKHLEENHLLCQNQHGFRPGRSCLTQLLKHVDTILNNFLRGWDTDSIYLDFAKAFDKVDHEILLNKLHSYGIRGKLLEWIKSYLSNRVQTVAINGVHSYPAKVLSGVPQGTVLGPILFLIYINDLNKCITSSIVSHFADDTRILKAIATTSDVALLQHDLLETISWSNTNKMKLHEKKFELLCHSIKKSNPLKELPFSNQFYEYHTNSGNIILPCEIVKDLGVHITPDINWSPHINIIADKARQLMAWVLSVFRDRSEKTMMALYNSLIRSRLEYCSALWHPSKQEDIIVLESIQRLFTSKIQGLADYSYWDRLRILKLLSLQRRRERFIIIQTWKIINNQTPNDLQFEIITSERRGVKVKVPPLNMNASQRARSAYESSFAVLGPKLFNTLPRHISTITKKGPFKTALSKHLESIPDEPPVDGVTSRNSLLDRNRLQLLGGRSAATAGDAGPHPRRRART